MAEVKVWGLDLEGAAWYLSWLDPLAHFFVRLGLKCAAPGVLWKKAPVAMRKPLKPYHFKSTLGAQKASSKYCQISTSKQ